MTTTAQIVDYLDEILETATTPDYPNALNGLQLDNSGTTHRIAAAVDASSRTMRGAMDAGANLLIVHHGLFWGGLRPLRGPQYHRLRDAIAGDLAVYSSHLPLDRHPLFGNNTLLAAELGLEPAGEFARFGAIAIGVRGTADIATAELAGRAGEIARAHGGSARSTHTAPGRRTRAWGLCTGAGASSETLREAHGLGLDTLIVGEGPHHTAVEADELGIVVIYAGHYATETPGVRALASHVSDRFGLPWTFIDAPTGL